MMTLLRRLHDRCLTVSGPSDVCREWRMVGSSRYDHEKDRSLVGSGSDVVSHDHSVGDGLGWTGAKAFLSTMPLVF
jgi:hypothetical protein